MVRSICLVVGALGINISKGNTYMYNFLYRHQRSSPAPSGNSPAVRSSNCYANPAGRPAVHDDNTAAITLGACQKAYRIQATGTRAQGFIRRHARVSRGTTTPARPSPIAAVCVNKLTGWSLGHWWSWRGRRGGGGKRGRTSLPLTMVNDDLTLIVWSPWEVEVPYLRK